MATNKATHKGSCQVCGSVQKLPGGLMAKHGYTTKWGFFSGTCIGSGYLSFEKSTDAIEGCIRRAEDNRRSLEGFKAKLLARPTEPTGWLHLYRKDARTGRSSYRWMLCDFVFNAIETPSLDEPVLIPSYRDPETGKLDRLAIYGLYSKDILDFVASANQRYAQDVQGSIDQLSRYIE